MSVAESRREASVLSGERVALLGPLAGMSKRELQQLLRDHGGQLVDRDDPAVSLLVAPEPRGAGDAPHVDPPDLRRRLDAGAIRLWSESQLWQRLGLVEPQADVHRLYTPAMLAESLRVSVGMIRRWHRRGLIVAAREVRRLPYFDFGEVAVARRLAELLAAGVSPAAIERKLATLRRLLPEVSRPLAQLPVVVSGRQLLLRAGPNLVEPGGQLRIDFDQVDDDAAAAESAPATPVHAVRPAAELIAAPQELLRLAAQLEDEGRLEESAEMYRAAMATAGPSPECCFRLAELLYQLGDLSAARERYYMAIELDEDLVEARANLGCVLAELRQWELAVAAFRGALAYHEQYADAHYHLARTLDSLAQPDEAVVHWQAFLQLAPDSPWADEARARLGLD
jgi:tetratricopeptide (TPR) repeat protein